MSNPGNLRPTVAPDSIVQHPAARTSRPLDAPMRHDDLAGQLAVLLGRPARVLDLAALASTRALDAMEPDACDLMLGVRLEALISMRGADAMRSLLGDLARRAGACLIEHEPGAPSDAMLEVFAFVRELTPHQARRLGTQWPVCFASNRYWYLSGQVGAFDRFQTAAYAALHVHGDTRRYYFGGGLVVKVHRYDHPRFGAANREQLNAEAAFLRNPPPDVPAPPLVLTGETSHDGWLVRGHIEGELLLDLMIAGRPYDAATIVHDVLAQLVALERSGLYHNDVRTWNVIVDADGHASLIDYGSIIDRPVDSAWPWDVFLSFLIFAREVHGRTTTLWPRIRRPWFDPDGLPGAHAFRAMLESPAETRSFARLQQDLSRAPTARVNSSVRPILAAIEDLDRHSEVERQHRDAAFEDALSGKDATLMAREGDLARLAGELAEAQRHLGAMEGVLTETRRQLGVTEGALADAQRRLGESERALTGTQQHAAALDRQLAAMHRSKSWRVSAPLRTARRCIDALMRGFKPR